MSNTKHKIMSIKQAAERLKCTRQNVAYLLVKGRLTGWQVNGKCWVVDRSSVERYERERDNPQ